MKSALFAGTMTGVLGSTWFAKPKVESGYQLATLSKDKFQKNTKKLQNLPDNSTAKQALASIQNLKADTNNIAETSVAEIFGSNTSVSKETLTTRIQTIDEHIKKINSEIEQLAKSKTETIDFSAVKKQIENNVPNGKQLLENYGKIIGKESDSAEKLISVLVDASNEHNEKKVITQRLLNSLDSGGSISVESAKKSIKQFIFDCNLERLQVCYEEIKSHLPKARIKGAIKWFALGTAASIVSNMIFGLFRKKSN